MTVSIPRPEHPRPQFQRKDWINLNGPWTFAFDFGKSGWERNWKESKGFEREILVPFCPESELSGVGHTDFIEAMWYHRVIEIPETWAGQKALLHFGGVDYECEVYVDGRFVARHQGGASAFTVDLTAAVEAGKTHHLVLAVRDELRRGEQPGGKQCPEFHSHGCSYTRTTGIWQTVWMESVSPAGLLDCGTVPDNDSGRFILTPRFHSVRRGLVFRAVLRDGDQVAAEVQGPAADGVPIVVDVPEPRSWSPDDPFLYDLDLEVLDRGTVIDMVTSYAGLRKIHCEDGRFHLNNQPVFLSLVLDQGFYPDGIWTAPTDEALKKDIELSMAAGFNGARLHQKVFEDRFHYWADRLGYLTWGESSSWGVSANHEAGARRLLAEWREIVLNARNHPSIIAWSPLNETHVGASKKELQRFTEDLYELTRAIDPTRPVNDSSGYIHFRTDVYTVHNYQGNPGKLREELALDEKGRPWRNVPDHDAAWEGQPYIVDEFGGIGWIPPEHRHTETSWGYGGLPETVEELYARLEGQVDAMLFHPHVAGWCYTQLTDIEQEQNGLYYYDRTPKFDLEKIHGIFSKRRAAER